MSFDTDKRSGRDRRIREIGPPQGRGERRRTVERRQTEIAEISFIEWAATFVKYQGTALADMAEQHAEILDKVKR